jgi:hypothetical protein
MYMISIQYLSLRRRAAPLNIIDYKTHLHTLSSPKTLSNHCVYAYSYTYVPLFPEASNSLGTHRSASVQNQM